MSVSVQNNDNPQLLNETGEPMPRVSVVMPVFNGERYIGEAIDSVLAQHKSELELIVVDDGSTDKTLEIAKRFADTDPRVRLVTRPNSGRPAFPRNDGIAMARGEYLCFIDHDDIYDADRTWLLLDGLERNPEWVAVFHDLRMIDSEGKSAQETYLSGPDFLGRATPYILPLAHDWYECGKSFFVYQSLYMGALHTMSVLIALKRVPAGAIVFDTSFSIGEDTDQWIRLALQGKMGYLNRVLGSYRQHETSITQNRELYLKDTLQMWQRNFERVKQMLSLTEICQYRLKISLRFSHLGHLRYLESRFLDARLAYREALRWNFNRESIVGYLKTFMSPGFVRTVKSRVFR